MSFRVYTLFCMFGVAQMLTLESFQLRLVRRPFQENGFNGTETPFVADFA